ncbi:hypothetical protein Bca52824_095747 [Brassica carinata]|uniref:ACT domain-containing protein ACR n=1 Tax=Brassica carinata TaxID=52824 RepID=A0A8X7P2T6_BRACI|nr:hypothetical protein Bca52824_095747 [Brassica carinata]
MRAPSEHHRDRDGEKGGEPHVITVNCPNRTGLGFLWVVPHYDSLILRWSHLNIEMVTSQDPACICAVCPLAQPTSAQFDVSFSNINSCLLAELLLHRPNGLLHGTVSYWGCFSLNVTLNVLKMFADVTQVLTELEFSIQSVKVTTTPDGRVLDLFFITENLDILHTNKCQDETLEQFRCVLGESCLSCELNLAVAEELFMSEQLTDEGNPAQVLSDDMIKMKSSSVITISYGRFLPQTQGHRDIELFVQVNDEKKILDPDKQNSLCSRLKAEMLHPLRVILTNRGLDIELVVANPVELSGKGRPRVFYDAFLSLKVLGICAFLKKTNLFTEIKESHCLFQLGSFARNEMAYKVIRTFKG